MTLLTIPYIFNRIFFQVLRRFPDCIQADLTYELYQVVFQNVDAFKYATVSCLRALALKFKTMTLHVNNYPLRHGEEINHLYILGKGSLEILIDGDLVELLGEHVDVYCR